MESFGWGFDLGVAGSDTSGSTAASLAALLAAGETQALALDFTDDSAYVIDTTTPANNYDSTASGLLTYTAPSAKYILNDAGVLVSGSTIRTEYDVNGNPLGVRVEEARTNLALYSNAFNNAGAWVVNSIGLAQNVDSPLGTGTGWTMTATAGTGNHWDYQDGPSATTRVSVFAKAGTTSWISLGDGSGHQTHGAFFNLSAGTVGTVNGRFSDATIESFGNGWYRCSATTSGAVFLSIGMATADGENWNFNAAGTETVFLAGYQAESGAFTTSYISTTSATVTRAADSGITLATSAYPHSATVNSAMIRYRPLNVAAAMVALRWDDGTANEVVSVGHSAAAALGLTVTDGGAAQTAPLTDGTATAATWEKVAVSWKANDFLFSDNGAAAVADTSGTLPTVTSLDIGPTLSGHISQILVVPVEKTAAEVATMATP